MPGVKKNREPPNRRAPDFHDECATAALRLGFGFNVLRLLGGGHGFILSLIQSNELLDGA